MGNTIWVMGFFKLYKVYTNSTDNPYELGNGFTNYLIIHMQFS